MGEASERAKAQAAMAEAVRSIGEAHAAMVATLARMVQSGESTADRDVSELHALREQITGSMWPMQRAAYRWRSAVRSEHTRAALAKAQGRGDG